MKIINLIRCQNCELFCFNFFYYLILLLIKLLQINQIGDMVFLFVCFMKMSSSPLTLLSLGEILCFFPLDLGGACEGSDQPHSRSSVASLETGSQNDTASFWLPFGGADSRGCQPPCCESHMEGNHKAPGNTDCQTFCSCSPQPQNLLAKAQTSPSSDNCPDV